MVLNEGGAWGSTAWRRWLREEGGYKRRWRQEAARGMRWMVLPEGGAWVSTAWRQWLREEGGYKRRWLRGSGGYMM
ncbi:MAG: hypothetical protein ACK523_02960 [Pirellulaceae bacterium]